MSEHHHHECSAVGQTLTDPSPVSVVFGLDGR